MKRLIKVPSGLATAIISQREASDKGYNVNRVIRTIDLFICLKSESHKIHNYTKQLPYILELCKCSKATFYARLNLARELGLITVDRKDLILSSWKHLSDLYLFPLKQFIEIPYDTTNKAQTVRYLLVGIEFNENRERQRHAALKRLTAHPEFETAFKAFCTRHNIKATLSLDNFEAAKQMAFAEGTECGLYNILHEFNPSLSRNVKTISQAHGLKNWQGAAYIKRQLFERGLATIVKRTPTKCKYKDNNKLDKSKRGASKYGRYYNQMYKTSLWYLPDEILLNPELFSTITQPQTLTTPAKAA